MSNTSKGISPVIGVILLVAVTVALISLSTFVIYDISNDKDVSSSTASITSNSNDIQLVRNDGFEKIKIQYENGEIVEELTEIGESHSVNIEGNYNIIGVSPDGDKRVIDTITVDSGTTEILFESENITIGDIAQSESFIGDITIGNTSSETTNEELSLDTNIELGEITKE